MQTRYGHLDLLGPNYSWLIWDPDPDRLDLDLLAGKLLDGDNVAVLRSMVTNTESLDQDMVHYSVY